MTDEQLKLMDMNQIPICDDLTFLPTSNGELKFFVDGMKYYMDPSAVRILASELIKWADQVDKIKGSK